MQLSLLQVPERIKLKKLKLKLKLGNPPRNTSPLRVNKTQISQTFNLLAC